MTEYPRVLTLDKVRSYQREMWLRIFLIFSISDLDMDSQADGKYFCLISPGEGKNKLNLEILNNREEISCSPGKKCKQIRENRSF